MTARALHHLERFLERASPGFADDRRLHDEARALSEAYTTGRPFPADAAASVAYLAHFGPRAIAATSHALSYIRSAPSAAIDVGAGSGASTLALVMAGASRVTLVDTSAAALAMARRLLEGTGADVTVHARDARDARGFVDKRAELLLSAFAFGEMGGDPLETFTSLTKVAPSAHTIVVVDAGDRARSRRIQTARDGLAAQSQRGRWAVRAPCAHVDPCPALVRERDWCHARIDKHLAAHDQLARFARAVGRDDERMNASFLVVDDQPRTEGDALVVIGDPLKEKGRARLPVCGPGGLRFLQALKRDRDAFAALLEVPRGARISVDVARDVRDDTAHVHDAALLTSRTE